MYVYGGERERECGVGMEWIRMVFLHTCIQIRDGCGGGMGKGVDRVCIYVHCG